VCVCARVCVRVCLQGEDLVSSSLAWAPLFSREDHLHEKMG